MHFLKLSMFFSYLLKVLSLICYGLSMSLKNLSFDLSDYHYGRGFYAPFQPKILLEINLSPGEELC